MNLNPVSPSAPSAAPNLVAQAQQVPHIPGLASRGVVNDYTPDPSANKVLEGLLGFLHAPDSLLAPVGKFIKDQLNLWNPGR
jgi:hypothetical protein